MARKKAPAKPATLVTTYTDRVELKQGDEPLRIGDLEALVKAVKDQWMHDETAEVTFMDGLYDPFSGTQHRPRTIAVTSTSSTEENL